ncbi:zinc-binding dehydrogenase [bacterium]|nr:zinc-binding dehydrogenase [bacterium]
MEAAIFRQPYQPLSIEDVPVPLIASDQVLIKVIACGVCHTDLHYIDHGVKTFKEPPLILGHECSGIIEKVGTSVTNWKEGDRVLLPAVVSCGVCRMCRLGRENICEQMKMFGNHVNGAFAEYIAAPAKDIFSLPQQLPLAESCIIADALSTPYHAVKNRAQVGPGDRVVVFGCGGVGINVVQVAAAAGARVVAVDLKQEKLELAKKLGASETLNPSKCEFKKELKRVFEGGADIAFEAIGNPVTLEQAVESVRIGGRVCIIGYSDKPFVLNAARVMFRELEIFGSLGCRAVDYPAIIQLAAENKIKVLPVVTHSFHGRNQRRSGSASQW